MDFDDDEPPAAAAKPIAKFLPRPKVKARAPPPKKVTSTAKTSVPLQAAGNQSVASPTKTKGTENDTSVSPDASNAGDKSKISVEETTYLQIPSGADPLLSSMENLNTISSVYMEENANFKESTNQRFLSEEAMTENTEGFTEFYSVDDIMPQSTGVVGSTFDASSSHNEEDTPCGSLLPPFPFLQMESIQLETKEEQAFSPFDFMSEVDLSSGKRASKFQPKLKQKQGKKTMENESASNHKEGLMAPSDTHNTNEGFSDGGSLDLPDVMIDDAFPPSSNSDNLFGSFELSTEFVPDLPSCTDGSTDCHMDQMEELPRSSSGVIHDDSSQQNASLADDMHFQPVPSMPEAENNNGRNEEKAGSKKRKPSSRSNKDKDTNGRDKPVRKRKKATKFIEKSTEASEKSKKQPPKKFSHTTRRRNKSTNKSLLDIPEDEIDHLSLPIKDLIMLGEHRERKNKEVYTTQTVRTIEENIAPVVEVEPEERTSDDMWKSPYDEEEEDVYNYTQVEGSSGHLSTSTIAQDTAYFNYHSHMNKTPVVKWTKQETKLFYECVQQFGSVFSMIKHRFPGRTRKEIKSKYKNEEKKQPAKLFDAMSTRSIDLSQYELVIASLQENIDQEEAGFDPTGNEGILDEGTAEDTQELAEDEGAKTEENDDGLGVIQDPDEPKIESPTMSNGSDLDTYDWTEYKSVF